MGKLVSIVVPVYNVEKYLSECLNSLVSQTMYNNLEIIIVEDYSKDNSLKICKEYVKKYQNVKLYQTNGKGQSDARNTGLEKVTSPYVMFVDSDDILPSYAVYKLYSAAIKNKVNIAVGDLEMFPTKTPNYVWKKLFGKGNRILDIHGKDSDLIYLPSPCNKIFKTDFLIKEEFRFMSGLNFEDANSIVPLMISARKIALVDTVVYRYRQREEQNSIMNNIYIKKNFFDHLFVNENIIKYRHTSAALNVSIQQFVTKTYTGFLNNIDNQEVGLTYEEKKEIFKRLVKLFKQVNVINMKKYLMPINKVRYYAIVENNFKVFLDGYISTNELTFLEGKALPFVPRKRATVSFLPDKWNVIIDRITNHNGITILEGLIEYDFISFDKFINKSLSIEISNDKNETIKVSVDQFWRYDSPSNTIGERHVGIRAEISEKIIVSLGEVNTFKFILEDEYNNTILKPIIFSGILNQYNRLHKVNSGYIRVKYSTYSKKLKISFEKRKNLIDYNRNCFKKMKEKKVPVYPRVMYYISHPILKRKNINIIAERKDTFQDNSSHIFKIASSYKKKENFYYLVDGNSKAYEEAKKYGKVIKLNTLKHWLYLLHAKNVISSYSIEGYLLPRNISRLDYFEYYADIVNYKKIQLQHGVVYNDFTKSASKYRIPYDKIVITNKSEEKMYEKSGYHQNDMIKTGLARFDALNLKTNKEIKKILFMPTWRSYLAKKSYLQDGIIDNSSFLNSDYFANISKLLNNEKLTNMLNEKNIDFIFYPHYEMQDYITYFKCSEQIKMEMETSVQKLLQDADLVITDYSSIFLDALFMKKPVIFFQFDKIQFFIKHYKQGYIDFEDGSYGMTCDTVDEVVDLIQEYVNNGYEIISEETYNKLFAYYRGNSNKQILDNLY